MDSDRSVRWSDYDDSKDERLKWWLMVCMLMMISCTLSMDSENCHRPWPRSQRFVLGLGLGLENSSSFSITVVILTLTLTLIFWYHLLLLAIFTTPVISSFSLCPFFPFFPFPFFIAVLYWNLFILLWTGWLYLTEIFTFFGHPVLYHTAVLYFHVWSLYPCAGIK